MDRLIEAIRTIRRRLREGAFTSEADISQKVVTWLLEELGWDWRDPKRVRSEFKVGSRRVDYALQHDPFGAVVLIEVKDVGKATSKGEDQLFDYCSKNGVPVAVLTDGGIWNFYHPAGAGSYEQRRIAVVDLQQEETSECAQRLARYLAFDTVTSGKFEEHAKRDYRIHREQILAREQFRPALESLVAGTDTRLVSLFSDEVERRCKIRPQEVDVRSYLQGAFGGKPVPDPLPVPFPDPLPRTPASYTLHGETTSCNSDMEVLQRVLTALQENDPDFYGRLAPRLAGRTRNHLSQDPNQIYPKDTKKDVRRAVKELPGGWWLATNTGSATKGRQLEKARKVAGLSPDQLNWQLKGKT